MHGEFSPPSPPSSVPHSPLSFLQSPSLALPCEGPSLSPPFEPLGPRFAPRSLLPQAQGRMIFWATPWHCRECPRPHCSGAQWLALLVLWGEEGGQGWQKGQGAKFPGLITANCNARELLPWGPCLHRQCLLTNFMGSI